jgi:hypothetical protein
LEREHILDLGINHLVYWRIVGEVTGYATLRFSFRDVNFRLRIFSVHVPEGIAGLANGCTDHEAGY